MHPSIHALGVYIEWICIPACTGLLLAVHLAQNNTNRSVLHYGLLLSLIFVVSIALFYLITGNTTFDGRLSAFYLSPNHLALYIAPLIFIPFIIHCYKTLYCHLLSWIILGASLLIIFYTHSFNTILALCLTITTVTVFIFKKRLFSFLIIGVLFLLLCSIGYQKMITSNSDFSHGSLASRIMIWDVTLFFIQESPLTGHEIDNFQSHYLNAQKWFSPYPDWAVPTPHNLFFTLLYAGGFFSLFFFVLFYARILFLLYMHYSVHKDTLSVLYTASLLLIIFSGIGDTPYWKNDLSLLFWIFIALAISHCTEKQYILSSFSRTQNK
ncbi:MAG: O-antigen ligase family protein [Parcubacteria group bacterium]|jgi:O-antigen ligase